MDEKENVFRTMTDIIELHKMFQLIFDQCNGDGLNLKLFEEAVILYKEVHDRIVDFRKNDLFEEDKLSIKSKSLGLIMRVSAVICFQREACKLLRASETDEGLVFNKIIRAEDFEMAKKTRQVSL